MAAVESRLIKGSYQLTAQLEETPLCLVYRGEILTTRAPLLIKLYKKEHLGDNFGEAALKLLPKIENLNHPGILKVYDHHLAHEGLYQILELPAGKTLAEVIKEKGALPLGEALDIVQQIGAALSYAQENGLVHGSLSPDKIYLGPKNQVKIGDFALVDYINKSNLVRANVILTEATYLAPEQIRGGITTASTDVYAFGLVVYFLTSGQPPFAGATNTAVALKHLREEAPHLPESAAPSWLAEILVRALAKEPSARFQNPLEIIQVIRNHLPPPGQPIAARPPEIKPERAEPIVQPQASFRIPDRAPRTPWAAILLILFFLAAAGWLAYHKLRPARIAPPPVQENTAAATTETAPASTAEPAPMTAAAPTAAETEALAAVPDLSKMTLKDAKDLLLKTQTGLQLPGVDYLSPIDYQKLIISKQDPAAGDKTVPAAIKVWLDPAPTVVKKSVPSLVGLSQETAKNDLAQAGLANIRIILQKTKDSEIGRVRWQSPAARETVPADNLITLVVGGGRSGAATPLKASRVAFVVPEGRFPWEIMIKGLDSTGESVATQGLYRPGVRIDVPLIGVGETTGKIYFNGILVKEWNL